MKLKQLFFGVIALTALASCRGDHESAYAVETCVSPANQSHFVDARALPRWNNKYWTVVAFNKEQDWVQLMYIGDPFDGLCVKEVNGMWANVKGAFLDVKAYVKATQRDSFEIPMTTTVMDSTQKVIQWQGAYKGLDLQPYYLHYAGKIWPVVYIKLSYTYYLDDHGWAYDELAKDYRDLTFVPTGDKF